MQFRAECEVVMNKLARIAESLVDLGDEKYDLSEEDPPSSILDSLPRFVSLITTRSLTLSI